jgi:hypothetical protein
VAVDDAGDVVSSVDPAAGARAWKVTRLPGVSGYGLSAVSCPSVSLCVAIDYGGQVFTSQDPSAGA